MSLFASLLVNAVIAATPATPLPWYNIDDYPMQAFEREWRGTTTFEVLVAPNGKAAGCRITTSSGYEQLDKQTCFVAMKRARFTQARGPDGAPAYGTYRSMVMWHRPDQEKLQAEVGPDIELSVSALPAGTEKPAAVKLAYLVDADGKPSNCTVLPDSKKQPAELVNAACTQLFSRLSPAPVAANGAKVPAVKAAAVLFTQK
jgi:TonB family protein